MTPYPWHYIEVCVHPVFPGNETFIPIGQVGFDVVAKRKIPAKN
jgi:hypothetical protein